MHKPADIVDRDVEWSALTGFVRAGRPGSLAVVRGRRRMGKSFLLRRLCDVAGGLYHQAAEEQPRAALDRLGVALATAAGQSAPLALADWDAAFAAVGASGVSVVVLDEFPYWVEQSPELPSVLQRWLDDSRARRSGPSLILCGSALSMMARLLAGRQPLRGRAVTDLVIDAFDYRTSRRFLSLRTTRLAFEVDAVVGGTPGYRDLLRDLPRSAGDFDRWVESCVLDPSTAMYREAEYLLDIERSLADRALYQSVLGAIASGASSQGAIATKVGREQRAVQHPLRMLEETGFIARDDDLLRARRPIYRIVDPIVRFHHVVVRPDQWRFDDRRTGLAWSAAGERFRAQVLGPHFEDVAREFARRYASQQTLGATPARVGSAVLNDAASRSQHQVDVVVTDGHGPSTRLLALGEPKVSDADVSEVDRLDRIRATLARRSDLDVSETKLLVFTAGRISRQLAQAARARGDIELIDLARLYEGD